MMSPGEVQARWRARSGSGSERALHQEHLRDLRAMLEQDGAEYVVEQPELAEAARLDWSAVEPAIFGTLFERSLDPGSRSKAAGASWGSRNQNVADSLN